MNESFFSISLRHKVIIGAAVVYLFMAATILGSYYSMQSLERKIGYLEDVSKIEESVLEIRRFEKNFFLYGDQESLTTARYHIRRARFLLDKNVKKIEHLFTSQHTARFKEDLTRYEQLLGDCNHSRDADEAAKEPHARPDCEGSIRKVGTSMAEFAEAVVKRKRDSIRETMSDAVKLPLLGLLVSGLGLFAIGSFLFIKVTRSLQLLEKGASMIAQGAFEPVQPLPAERDIRNILVAFNSMAVQLRTREELLVQSRKLASLGTMLAGVAHEVNNPLSNISSSCQILLEELDDGDTEFQRKTLTKVLEQVEKAHTLILNLLEVSRTKELHLESVNLKETIERTLGSLAAHKPPEVRVTVQLDGLLRVSADRRKMEQVFTNLISNAFQAIDGAGEVNIRALAKKDGTVRIIVSDTGRGIAEEDLSRVFDPFFTTKDVGKGTGLGLFIAHDIIERHQGTIQVKSSRDKGGGNQGTAFCIRLPVAEGSR